MREAFWLGTMIGIIASCGAWGLLLAFLVKVQCQ